MRTLTQQELNAVSGAGMATGGTAPSKADIFAAIQAALAKRGITIALDQATCTLTITTPKGSKVITLPSHKPTAA